MLNESERGQVAGEVSGSSRRSAGGRSGDAAAQGRVRVKRIGIWVEGRDHLGAAYEGIWRVIKRFLLSSEGGKKQFCFLAPARVEEEIRNFLCDLPEAVRDSVEINSFGDPEDSHSDDEAIRQAAYANHLKVDAWLIANPMWSAAKHLIKPKVVWFHDFLLAEFPQSYPRKLFVEFQKNVRDLSDAGAFFIFLSPHVKNRHGHEVCGIRPDQSMLIVTPAMDASAALADVPDDPLHAGDLIRSELRENLRSWCTPAHAELFFHHISSYPFESVPYFFVSSQNREHKGFLRLAQIHASMIRELYLPYSIFTTALVDVTGRSPLEQFLTKELLMGDFMSVGKVTDVTHALLYKLARMTIHPSTFEGNLPLPFAESVSVGTPCIMPYSHAFVDLVDASMHPWIFYSPTKVGLIGKVQEVEARRSEFVAAQKQIFSSLRSYSLKDYFTLQMEAFEKSARIEPDAIQLVIGAHEKVRRVRRRPGLKELFGGPANARPASRETTQYAELTLQARTWREFELASAPKEAPNGAPVMHWAAYLTKAHPRDKSYFLISVRNAAKEIDSRKLRLGAEIGTWIDDEYVIADNGEFQFGSSAELPSELLRALELTGAMRTFAGADSRIGWLKLGWSEGVIPEIRVSGTPVAKGSKVTARLACLSGFDRPFTFDSLVAVSEGATR